MGDPYRKLRPGQRLGALPHEAWNAMMDAARSQRGGSIDFAGGGGGTPFNSVVILVKNMAGVDLGRGACLALGTAEITGVSGAGPVFTAADNLNEFLGRVVAKGVMPAEDDDPVCVLVEAIPAGRIGKAVAMGVVPALCSVNSTGDRYLRANDGETILISNTAPTAMRLLWSGTSQVPLLDSMGSPVLDGSGNPILVASNVGSQWGLVLIGGGGGFDCSLLADLCGGITATQDFLIGVSCDSGGNLIETFATLHIAHGLVTGIT